MIFFPEKKEPHYFSTDLPGNRWHPNWSSYSQLYSGNIANNAVYRGDASVNYLYSTEAAKNISESVPQAKILICLRSPVSFIKSYHNQKIVNLDEDIQDLGLAWDVSGMRDSTKAREPKLLNYKSIGLFYEQISRYRTNFSNDHIRVLTLEDLKKDPRKHYLAILDWLGLPDDNRTEFDHINPAANHRSQALARTLKYPPKYIRDIVHPLKRVLGVNSLGIAKILDRVNKGRGYRLKEIDKIIEDKIAHHYAKDQKLLKEHYDLWLIGPEQEG